MKATKETRIRHAFIEHCTSTPWWLNPPLITEQCHLGPADRSSLDELNNSIEYHDGIGHYQGTWALPRSISKPQPHTTLKRRGLVRWRLMLTKEEIDCEMRKT